MSIVIDLLMLKKKKKTVEVALLTNSLTKHARVRMERRLKGLTSEIAAYEEECEVQSGIRVDEDGGLWA